MSNASESPATVEDIRLKLESSLQSGWREFQQSEQSTMLAEFLEFLIGAGFYESRFRSVIPNPAYDYAARIIGRPLLETARRMNLHFGESFPGAFAESEEFGLGDYEVRRFFLTAFRDGRALCRFALSFPHRHEALEFPHPPEVAIDRVY